MNADAIIERRDLNWPGTHVEIDDPVPLGALDVAAFVGAELLNDGDLVRVVRVLITRQEAAAPVEVRGYMLARGRLHLRLPSHTGAWGQMDTMVSAALEAPIVPYIVDGDEGAGWARVRPAGEA